MNTISIRPIWIWLNITVRPSFRHGWGHKSQGIRPRLNPPEADKGFIPRRLRRFNVFADTPLLCGGEVHSTVLENQDEGDIDGLIESHIREEKFNRPGLDETVTAQNEAGELNEMDGRKELNIDMNPEHSKEYFENVLPGSESYEAKYTEHKTRGMQNYEIPESGIEGVNEIKGHTMPPVKRITRFYVPYRERRPRFEKNKGQTMGYNQLKQYKR